MINSKIEWCDHTVNFWTGCKKVSPGCKYCYMYRDQERYGKDPTEVIQVNQSTIDNHLKNAKPGDLIFTCSWSDFFIEEADQWRDWAWDIIRSRPDLHWQILTKRPERIIECLPDDWGTGWKNVWLGVSAENEEQFNIRSQILCETPAAFRFISAEPLIGEITGMDNLFKSYWHGIHWVIIGGESGNEIGKFRYRPMQLGWVNRIMLDCIDNDVPVFVKQLGTYASKVLRLKNRHGGDITEWPERFQIRQMPKHYRPKK